MSTRNLGTYVRTTLVFCNDVMPHARNTLMPSRARKAAHMPCSPRHRQVPESIRYASRQPSSSPLCCKCRCACRPRFPAAWAPKPAHRHRGCVRSARPLRRRHTRIHRCYVDATASRYRLLGGSELDSQCAGERLPASQPSTRPLTGAKIERCRTRRHSLAPAHGLRGAYAYADVRVCKKKPLPKSAPTCSVPDSYNPRRRAGVAAVKQAGSLGREVFRTSTSSATEPVSRKSLVRAHATPRRPGRLIYAPLLPKPFGRPSITSSRGSEDV